MAHRWWVTCEDVRSRLSILAKYRLALSSGLRPPFETDRSPYSDVVLLIRLRNALVHYDPEWVLTERDDGRPLSQDEMHKFERVFGSKFDPNPLAGAKYRYWPERCLSAECARWAARSAEDFFGLFGDLMDPTRR